MRTRFLLLRFLRGVAVGFGVGTAFCLLLFAFGCVLLRLCGVT